MLLIKLIFSRFGPKLGLAIVSILPRSWSYKIGDWVVAILLMRRESELYRAIRANQSVIRNLPYEDERLHTCVKEVLTNAAESLIDWFAVLAIQGQLGELNCQIDEALIQEAINSQAEGRGVIIVGAHLKGFNMLLMKIAQEDWPVQILSYAEAEGSYQSDNEFRERYGLEITPISPSALRQAYQRLGAGGFVLTGVDRPGTGGEQLTFFGKPAVLPTGHARLALRTGSRIMVVAIRKTGEGSYHVSGAKMIDPDPTHDVKGDARRLAQRVIGYLEETIKERPSEWLMYVPVWPGSVISG